MASVAEAKRRLTIEATTRGVKEATTDAKALAGGMDAVAVAAQRQEKAVQSAESRLNSIQRKYDETFRAQMEMARVERDLQRAQDQGLITLQRRLELQSMAAERHGLATAAIKAETAATNQLTAANRQLAAANDNAAAFRRRNLTYQLFDVSQGFALGANPGLIAMQQGPQIAQLYAGAGGVNAALRDTMGLLGGIVKRFGPIGVAAGIAAGGILALQADIQETTGVAVSFGDVLTGAIQAAGDAVYQFLKPAIDTIAPFMASAWQMILDGAKAVGNTLIAGWVVQVEAFRRIWSDLPAILGDLGVQAVNALIGAFEDGYAVLVPKIKEFYRLLNPVAALADATGNSAIANALGTGMLPNDIKIGEITNKWAGAAGSAAADVANAAREAFARDFIGEAYDAALNDISGRAIDNYKKRMAEAEESAKKTGKAARDALDPWKGMRNLTEGGREWERWQQDQIRAAEDAKEAWQQVGSVLSGIFSQPFTDASDMLDRMLSQAGQIGSALQQAFEKAGKATGNPALAAAGGKIGAAFGGFGAGYQSQNPLMGGIGGALSGFAAGGPVGAIIGGAAGILGGIFGRARQQRQEREAAQSSLRDRRASIDALVDVGMGRGVGTSQAQYLDYLKEARDILKIASKAGDARTIAEVDQAVKNFTKTLKTDFRAGFAGMLDAFSSGFGPDSPFVQAQQSVIGMREQLKGFVADARFAGVSVGQARKAVQAYALAQIAGAAELSDVEIEFLRIRGTAAGLKKTLVDLGMSATAAGRAVDKEVKKALDKLRADYRDDVNRSINDLSGKSYLNDIADAQKKLAERLKDARRLGIDGSLAYDEFNLSIEAIVKSAGLSATELDELRKRFPQLADTINRTLVEIQQAFAETMQEFLKELRIDQSLSPLSPGQRLAEARALYEEVSRQALAGDTGAQDKLQGTITEYLRQAREFFGSTGQYAAIFDEIQSMIARLGGTAVPGTPAAVDPGPLRPADFNPYVGSGASASAMVAYRSVGNDNGLMRSDLLDLGKMIAAAIATQTEALSDRLGDLEAQTKKSGDAARLSNERKATPKAA